MADPIPDKTAPQLLATEEPVFEPDIPEWRLEIMRKLFHGCESIASMLDVGCSDANLSRHLNNWGLNLHYAGCDINKIALRKARASGVESIALGGLPDLPFKDSSFDVVTCFGTLLLVKDKIAAVRELFRVSRGTILTDIILSTQGRVETIYMPGAGTPANVTIPGEEDLFDILSGCTVHRMMVVHLDPGPSGFPYAQVPLLGMMSVKLTRIA